MWTRRQFLKTAGAVPLLGLAGTIPMNVALAESPRDEDGLPYSNSGQTSFGDWRADWGISAGGLNPGTVLKLDLFLHLSSGLIPAMLAAGFAADTVLMLVTSERCFDPDGWLRLPADDRMSTLITPTGIAIEGGSSNAISKSLGSRYRNPIDQLVKVPVRELTAAEGSQWAHFLLDIPIPADTPPGIYRLRFDFGVIASKRYLSLNGEGFANRPKVFETSSGFYSRPLPCSGSDVAGRGIDATQIKPHLYWVLLGQYNSNGYQGVVADEDRGHYAHSDRNIIPDEVILPLYDGRGNKIGYSLEPDFRFDMIDEQRNIPWNYASGEISVQVTGPDGKMADLGTVPFVEKKGRNPTTRKTALTSWKPQAYGRYTVVARGWILDSWGNRYEGGGSYHFWIAKRLTMATATFQGMPYPVGYKYGRDIGFAPPVAADVTITAELYPDSVNDPNHPDPAKRTRSLTCSGKATPGGLFGAAHGMKQLLLDVPGEYHAHVFATYTDPEGHLWVCSMRHAGVVYPPDSQMIAHGKKVKVGNQYLDRGETHFEGYVEAAGDSRHLDHINFPYNAGDCLLIASEGDGANKIEPVLTYEMKGSNQPYDIKLQGIGYTNLRINTSNGMSPHLYPEYITDIAYYYGAAPRPGFMSRFLVGEDGVRAPYWPVSATSFGGQIGASNNGDIQGDIYRLIGGAVMRRQGQPPLYAGYVASGFILPKGTNNNRVIGAGSEELIGADGRKFRFFLVSFRPGMVLDQGSTFVPAFQIDPILPVKVKCTLRWPDGTTRTGEGVGDSGGSLAIANNPAWVLDQPGVYTYTLQSDWQGFPGCVPGLPDEGGYFYVVEKARPEGFVPLKLNLKNQQSFTVADGLKISGVSLGDKVHYASITPGCVIEEGVLPVTDGKFEYQFSPTAVHQKVPIYDIANRRNGKAEIGRVIHLTFFAQHKLSDGTPYHTFARVILRGTNAFYTS